MSPLEAKIVWATGLITASMIVQFLFPRAFAKKVLNVDLDSRVFNFYFTHWALLAVVMGALIILVAEGLLPLVPVLGLVALEKLALVGLVLHDRKEAFAKKLFPAAIFDAFSSAFYFYLIFR